MPFDDRQRVAASAELARRRMMVWTIGLCLGFAVVIGATSIAIWLAGVFAVVGLVVVVLAVARYRQLVAVVERAGR